MNTLEQLKTAYNKGFAIAGFPTPQTHLWLIKLVLRINICAENPPLRKAENRYGQFKSTLQTMTPGNDKKYGRAFFDLIAEHPKLTFFIFLSQLA